MHGHAFVSTRVWKQRGIEAAQWGIGECDTFCPSAECNSLTITLCHSLNLAHTHKRTPAHINTRICLNPYPRASYFLPRRPYFTQTDVITWVMCLSILPNSCTLLIAEATSMPCQRRLATNTLNCWSRPLAWDKRNLLLIPVDVKHITVKVTPDTMLENKAPAGFASFI